MLAVLFGMLGMVLAVSLLLRLERRWRLRWWEVPIAERAAFRSPGGVYRESPQTAVHLERVPSHLRNAACASALPIGLLMQFALTSLQSLPDVDASAELAWGQLPLTLACLSIPSWLLPRCAVFLLRRDPGAAKRTQSGAAFSLLPSLIAIELIAIWWVAEALCRLRLQEVGPLSSLFAWACASVVAPIVLVVAARRCKPQLEHPSRYVKMGHELFELERPDAPLGLLSG